MTSPRASPSLLDRIASTITTLTTIPDDIHYTYCPRPSGKRYPSSQYTMEELEPWPEDDEGEDLLRNRKPTAYSDRKPPSKVSSPDADAWNDRSSSHGSASRDGRIRKPLFSGPPPRIAGSMVLPARHRTSEATSRSSSRDINGHDSRKSTGLSSLIFDYRQNERSAVPQDSIWRNIRRRERSLQADIQTLLDAQESGLKSAPGATPSETDSYSDTGSSTPTGTFYSTATSKSRMVNSLYIPPKSTADGNVVPVRQPKSSRPRGLKTARTGLGKSISALAKLKAEEDEHLEDALAERKKALRTLKRLSHRQENVTTELKALEEDEEEPLGLELRELNQQYDAVTSEIRELEAKVRAMRNHRQSLRERIDDVRNRREAGLSGYRGALKDVDTEVNNLMKRPPIQPLDLEALDHPAGSTTGGAEFMNMVPSRRTISMAQAWWESELDVLERRKAQIDKERQGLEQGGAVWSEVMHLVSDFEARLRQIMKGEQPQLSDKGKERRLDQDELIRGQLAEMDKVVDELKRHLDQAEDRGWTLLICAISAELEAFEAAQGMLDELISGEQSQPSPPLQASNTKAHENHDDARDSQQDVDSHEKDQESDNEVPPDLLVSHVEAPPSENDSELRRIDSQSDVPAEFLAEHNKVD